MVIKLKTKSDGVNYKVRGTSSSFVVLSEQATLGVYDTRNRPFALNMKYNGMVGMSPSILTTRQLKRRREIDSDLVVHYIIFQCRL